MTFNQLCVVCCWLNLFRVTIFISILCFLKVFRTIFFKIVFLCWGLNLITYIWLPNILNLLPTPPISTPIQLISSFISITDFFLVCGDMVVIKSAMRFDEVLDLVSSIFFLYVVVGLYSAGGCMQVSIRKYYTSSRVTLSHSMW